VAYGEKGSNGNSGKHQRFESVWRRRKAKVISSEDQRNAISGVAS